MSETLEPVTDTESVAADSREYVTFELGGETFAVDIAPLQEIVRLPQLVRVPLSPPSIRGVANLRGHVLPVADLREMAGFEAGETGDDTRVMVVNAGGLLGLIVDRVQRVLFVDAASVDDDPQVNTAVDRDLVDGVVHPGDGEMLLTLNLSTLVERAMSGGDGTRGDGAAAPGGAMGSPRDGEGDAEDDHHQIVAFRVGNEEFALPIHQIKEVVKPPESISGVPNAGAHVLGIMNLRGRSLPVASLRRMYGEADTEADDQQRVLVVPTFGDRNQSGAPLVGLLADEVNEVLRVPPESMAPVPPLLEGDGESQELTGVCRLDSGQRLVSVIAPERLFQIHDMQAALSAGRQKEGDSAMQNAAADDDVDRQYVVFGLAGEEYAVPISDAKEIVRVPENLTRVPRSPAFIEGVINLRGAVLPVVDLRRRFALATQERDDAQRIMVLRLADETRTGFIVDTVSEVLRVPGESIEAAPYMSAEQAEVITQVANLPDSDRIIQLLHVPKLLSAREQDEIGALDAAKEAGA